jgi:hypothetical protein
VVAVEFQRGGHARRMPVGNVVPGIKLIPTDVHTGPREVAGARDSGNTGVQGVFGAECMECGIRVWNGSTSE